MSSLHAKIENICRLCLSGDDSLESIFGDNNGGEQLQMIIYSCTTVKVQRKLGYPSSICVVCKTKIESFHQFREQCIQNDEYLRSAFLEPEVVIKTEPDVILEESDSVNGFRDANDDANVDAESDNVEIDDFDDDDDDDDDDEEEDVDVDVDDDDDDDDDDENGDHINENEMEEWDLESNGIEAIDLDNSLESISIQPDLYIPEYETTYKCDFCSCEFTVLEQLEKHITSHKEEKIFKCYYCPKTFHFAKNLNMHIEYIHSKAKYSQKSNVKAMIHTQHCLTHHGSGSTNGNGVLHAATNDNKDLLNNNIGTVGTVAGISVHANGTMLGQNVKAIRLPPVSRVTANLSTGTSRSIISHECHVCHKSFNEASNLRHHMLQHTGEKPYKCDICSKSFYNASTLKTHYRIHSDQNPYRCRTCTKMFDNARSLELHYRTHTGEKPYACDVCLKKFSCSSNLKRHRKLHDRD